MTTKLYLLMRIGPTGFKHVDLKFIDSEPDVECLYEITRGEGQILAFEMIGADCSSNFSKALDDGTLIEDIGNWFHSVDLQAAIDKSRELQRKIEEMRKEKL